MCMLAHSIVAWVATMRWHDTRCHYSRQGVINNTSVPPVAFMTRNGVVTLVVITACVNINT